MLNKYSQFKMARPGDYFLDKNGRKWHVLPQEKGISLGPTLILKPEGDRHKESFLLRFDNQVIARGKSVPELSHPDAQLVICDHNTLTTFIKYRTIKSFAQFPINRDAGSPIKLSNGKIVSAELFDGDSIDFFTRELTLSEIQANTIAKKMLDGQNLCTISTGKHCNRRVIKISIC